MPTFSQEPLVLQDTHYWRKKIIYIFKNKKRESVLMRVFYVVFFFLSSIQRLCHYQNCEFFPLWNNKKRPLNYHLMVISLAICRLQNPITTPMKSISSWPQPLHTWLIAFKGWLYGCYIKVTLQGQSHSLDSWIPPKHLANMLQNESLQRMEWLTKETIFKYPLMFWEVNFKQTLEYREVKVMN